MSRTATTSVSSSQGEGDWRAIEALNVMAKYALGEYGKSSNQTSEAPLLCTGCGREPRSGENGQDEWRAYSQGACEIMVFCTECARQALGT